MMIPRQTYAKAFLVVALALVLFCTTVHAQGTTPSFKFDFETGTGPSFTFSRPRDGLVPVRLIFQKAKDRDGKVDESLPEVQVSPSLLSSETGAGSANVNIASGKCDPKRLPTASSAKFMMPKEVVQDLCLLIAPLPADGKFNGNLLVQSDKTDPVTKQFAISQPPASAPTQTSLIVTGPDKVNVRLPWRHAGNDSPSATFAVTIQEKSGKTGVEGLYAKMDVAKSPAGYDSGKVSFKINGTNVDLFTVDPADKSREIPPGGQTKLEVTLKDLQPGEYDVVFRFAGINAGSDDMQKLTLPVHVRRHPFWPVLTIFVASLISFLANKVVAGKRRRAALLEKIGTLRPSWLVMLGQTMPVVWVRAMLNRTEKLSSRFWLTSPEAIEIHLNGVTNIVKLLDQARKLRERLNGALGFLILRRVLPSFERSINRIGTDVPDDQAVTAIQAELTAFENWLKPDTFVSTSWANIQPSLSKLQSRIQGSEDDVTKVPIFVQLSTQLSTALKTAPTKPDEVEDAYHTYSQLMVLWEERKDKVALEECVKVATELDQLFDVTDRHTWERLRIATLEIRMPVNSDPAGFEAFAPLKFSVTAPDSSDDEGYLFNYRIEYQWHFYMPPKRNWYGRYRKEIKLEPVTLGPSVMQYFPDAGEVEVWVELKFQGKPIDVKSREVLSIGPTREFRIMKSFESAELLSWGVALALAVFSGLSIYYVNSAEWGSFKDFLTLFLWGAGIEQGKTFLQSAATK